MSEQQPDTGNQTGGGSTNVVPAPKTHAESQLMLADEMFKAARWPVLGVAVVGAVAWTLVAGMSGLWSAAVGGAVGFGSGFATLLLMRRTAHLNVQMLMAAVLGGFVGKMVVLLITLVLLRAVPGVHVLALGTTMLGVVLVSAVAETAVFRRTKIPTLILTEQPDDSGSTTQN
ncbi:hypothetical protein [Actinokineospora inagensis]|uniref:hypothetical protein n=1 Tax=Actinokineospora inagensis TaxID=103730 RepID=UPI00040F40A5|nr:hypothetical protein [Actinokineospora inagensis]